MQDADLEIQKFRRNAQLPCCIKYGRFLAQGFRDGLVWQQKRKPFTLTMYTSDRNADGDAIEYYAWEFKTCRGKPVGGSSADNQFTNMKYTIQSRPAFGVSPMTVSRVEELPAVA